MNEDAGRGGPLLVTCRLADGETLPMVVDTGCPTTAFEKSLEPQLGLQLVNGTIWNFGIRQVSGIYLAPRLYLGEVPLRMSGTCVVTFDRQRMATPIPLPAMGILGMDVLQNYCLQLDFSTGNVRFLGGVHADKTNWGTPFPLADTGNGCFAISENLAGVKGLGSAIDTGCDYGGWLCPEAWQQWTNPAASGIIHSPDGILGGKIYPGLDLHLIDVTLFPTNDEHISLNGIGLHFLSENLVTLDFPNRMMYLKRVNQWPLVDRQKMAAQTATARSALKFFYRLKEKSQLPGATTNDQGHANVHLNHDDSPYLDTITLDFLKDGDPEIYHYTFIRTSAYDPWKLQKAWRGDASDNVVEEYPLP